jgi:hypothetical protein
MKKLMIGIFLLTSLSSFAATRFIDDPSSAINKKGVCEAEAQEKVVSFAQENNANKINLDTFRLVGVDKGALNLVHYSWYELDVEIGDEIKTIRTLVQKNRLSGECL